MEFDNNQEIERDLNTEIDVEDSEIDESEVDEAENIDENGEEQEKVVDSPKKQSSKQDKAFAEMRRKLEAAEKDALRLREINARASAMFKEYGVKDINEYFDKVEVQMLEQKKDQLREAGYDEKTVEDMVKDTAEKMKLQRELETYKKQQYETQLVSAFNEVAQEYPDLVKSVDDISDEVWAKAEKGYSLLDAFESVNRKMLRERDAAKAKQKTLNNLNSKKHLKSEGDGPGNASDTMIDADVMQGYLDMGFTKKQAIAHYKKIYG